MAITLDTTSVGVNVSSSSITWQHICGTGATLLVVAIQVVDSVLAERTVSSVTHNGAALTNSGYNADYPTYEFRTEIWYKINPTIGGTPNIVVTMGGKCTDILANAISLKGTHPTTPINAGNARQGNTLIVSLTVTTTVADCWLVDSLVHGLASTSSCSADYTLIQLIDIGADIAGSQYRSATGAAGDYVMSWAAPTFDYYALSAVAIAPAVVAQLRSRGMIIGE